MHIRGTTQTAGEAGGWEDVALQGIQTIFYVYKYVFQRWKVRIRELRCMMRVNRNDPGHDNVSEAVGVP